MSFSCVIKSMISLPDWYEIENKNFSKQLSLFLQVDPKISKCCQRHTQFYAIFIFFQFIIWL